MISAARILAHDRRNAAMHEAGHVVIAWRYGLDAQAIIKPAVNRDVRLDKTWTGRTGHHIRPLSATAFRLLGLAINLRVRRWCLFVTNLQKAG